MAKLTGGIFGQVSGQLGGLVYYCLGKTQYIRRLPAKSTKAPTEKQLFRQNGFKLVSALVKPLAELLKMHFAGSWYSTTMKLNLKEALVAEGAEAKIDYSKVRLSKGKLTGIYILESILLEPGQLFVKWQSFRYRTRGNEVAVMLMYCPDGNRWHSAITNYSVEDGMGGMVIPRYMLGKELHGYIYFLDQKSRAVSDTWYLGAFNK
ncbi:DUF6266 family protein [Desertivirga xinjiangensis]|uniref:DUF6266 family protein n=1 Tax=Desertivirga xinjiangensis TaxID=539206 RepID=UPI00210BFB90|nr:DUF6266 family protein [Pedobacter xinjiangensis]